MLDVLLLFLPSFLGLVLINWQIFELFRLAKQRQSLAIPFITALVVAMIGLLISWGIVVLIAYELVTEGHSVVDWQISLLPSLWALILVYMNYNVRK